MQSDTVEASMEGTVPAQPTVVDDSVAEIETDAEGIKATPIPLAPAQKSYDKFSDLQKDIQNQAAKKAAATRQRSSPISSYGHG